MEIFQNGAGLNYIQKAGYKTHSSTLAVEITASPLPFSFLLPF